MSVDVPNLDDPSLGEPRASEDFPFLSAIDPVGPRAYVGQLQPWWPSVRMLARQFPIDEALLVPRAAFPQNLQERIPDVRFRQRTVGDREIKSRQVPAI